MTPAHDVAPLGPRFANALAFAAQVHATQTRKGKPTPYVAHLLAVAALVIEYGGDEDTAIAALLHDAPEDQGGRPMLERIRACFGDRVAGIVDECTDTYADPKEPWHPRKEAYIGSIPHKSAEGLLVSLADKVHNAREILEDYKQDGEAIWSRFNAGRADLLRYYRRLTEAFRGRTPDRLWQHLEETVIELEKLTGAKAS